MLLVIRSRAAARTAKQSKFLLIYGGDLVYHGIDALAVELLNFPLHFCYLCLAEI